MQSYTPIFVPLSQQKWRNLLEDCVIEELGLVRYYKRDITKEEEEKSLDNLPSICF